MATLKMVSQFMKLPSVTQLMTIIPGENHPAADSTNPPHILIPYHPDTKDGCANRTFNHLQYLTTPIGSLIREFNSTMGIPLVSWCRLIQQPVLCVGCDCMFSEDGYDAHIQQGRCTNTPSLKRGESSYLCSSFIYSYSCSLVFTTRQKPEPFSLDMRTFPKNHVQELKSTQDCLDTMTGRPFLEWNSRVGVPRDVWYLISSARVICADCQLVRSFEADHAHRDLEGKCADVGEGDSSIVDTTMDETESLVVVAAGAEE